MLLIKRALFISLYLILQPRNYIGENMSAKDVLKFIKDKEADTYIFKGEKRKKEKTLEFDKSKNPFHKLLSLNLK